MFVDLNKENKVVNIPINLTPKPVSYTNDQIHALESIHKQLFQHANGCLLGRTALSIVLGTPCLNTDLFTAEPVGKDNSSWTLLIEIITLFAIAVAIATASYSAILLIPFGILVATTLFLDSLSLTKTLKYDKESIQKMMSLWANNPDFYRNKHPSLVPGSFGYNDKVVPYKELITPILNLLEDNNLSTNREIKKSLSQLICDVNQVKEFHTDQQNVHKITKLREETV